MCASIKPGRRVRSPRSTTWAPVGCFTVVPASAMRSPCTSTSPGEMRHPFFTSSKWAACSTVDRGTTATVCPAAAAARHRNTRKAQFRRFISPRWYHLKSLQARKLSLRPPPNHPGYCDLNHKKQWKSSHPAPHAAGETESHELRDPHQLKARTDRTASLPGIPWHRLPRIPFPQAGCRTTRPRRNGQCGFSRDLLHGRVDPHLAGQPLALHPPTPLFRPVCLQRHLRPPADHLRRHRPTRRPICPRIHADLRSIRRPLDLPLFLPL